MNEPTTLRLRAGGSVLLPAGSTEQDIDDAGREPLATPPAEAEQPPQATDHTPQE